MVSIHAESIGVTGVIEVRPVLEGSGRDADPCQRQLLGPSGLAKTMTPQRTGGEQLLQPFFLHHLPSLNGVVPQHPPASHRLRWARRNAIASCPSLAQSRSANQISAQQPGPDLTISSTASDTLTLLQPRPESFVFFDSY